MDSVDWVEAGMVKPGMRQVSMSPPVSEIAGSVYDGVSVVVSYADGSTMAYDAWRELPIIRTEV